MTVMITFLLLWIAVVGTTNGMYTVQMRLLQYNNPNGHDSESESCDFIGNCDTYFIFCLRENGDGYADMSCLQQISTESNPISSDRITPPVTGALYAGSPVSNPITFRRNEAYSDSFHIAVIINDDDDISSDDLIDVVQFDREITPGSGWVGRESKIGIHNIAIVTAEFQVSCQANYYGSSCLIFCMNTDSSQGHYTCDSSGNRVCISGWRNTDSTEITCLTPICSSDCSPIGGMCNVPNECLCREGWRGINCDQCIPSTTCSADHGSCNNPGECICDTGYGGPNCNQDLDVCGHQRPCQNGATCTNNGPDQYSCSCPSGYTGINCETEVIECGSIFCFNGATCDMQSNVSLCQCAPGWTGATCEININECSPNPCRNGGTCTDLINGYSCQCVPGWTGTDCSIEINECIPNPCQNSGVCTDLLNDFNCQCARGWTGKVCSVNINECDPNPCQNEGRCQDLIAEFQCICSFTGFTGSTCNVDVNECVTVRPCRNGGTCTNTIGSYNCMCIDGFRGRNCQIEPTSPTPNTSTINLVPIMTGVFGPLVIIAACLCCCFCCCARALGSCKAGKCADEACTCAIELCCK